MLSTTSKNQSDKRNTNAAKLYRARMASNPSQRPDLLASYSVAEETNMQICSPPIVGAAAELSPTENPLLPPFTFNEDDVQRVRDILELHKGQWITAASIGMQAGFKPTRTAESVRKAVTVLVERDLLPIVSLRAGFMLTDQQTMVAKYAENLEQRRAGLDRRIQAVKKTHAKLLMKIAGGAT
jgi:hypothetical protein